MFAPRRLALAAVFVLLALSPAAGAGPGEVTFFTEDGLAISADLWSTARRGAPAVIALHMYRSDRRTFRPVAGRFARAGIEFLALDLRGHGRSAVQDGKDLAENVRKRDPELFRVMYRDALAARRFLADRGADADRIALLGASVGCSVAIHAVSREPRLRAACVMTPGTAYLGVPTLDHLALYGDRPLLILSSREEAGKGALEISRRVPGAELVLFEEKGIHGTRMFGRVPGVEERIVRWFAERLGAPVALDGVIRGEEAAGARTFDLPGGTAFLAVRGDYLHVGFRPAPGKPPPALFRFAWKVGSTPGKARAVTVTAAGSGDRARVRFEVLRRGKWWPVRIRRAKGARPVGAARGKAAEMLIPLGRPHAGIEKGARLAVGFGLGEGEAVDPAKYRAFEVRAPGKR